MMLPLLSAAIPPIKQFLFVPHPVNNVVFTGLDIGAVWSAEARPVGLIAEKLKDTKVPLMLYARIT